MVGCCLALGMFRNATHCVMWYLNKGDWSQNDLLNHQRNSQMSAEHHKSCNCNQYKALCNCPQTVTKLLQRNSNHRKWSLNHYKVTRLCSNTYLSIHYTIYNEYVCPCVCMSCMCGDVWSVRHRYLWVWITWTVFECTKLHPTFTILIYLNLQSERPVVQALDY